MAKDIAQEVAPDEQEAESQVPDHHKTLLEGQGEAAEENTTEVDESGGGDSDEVDQSEVSAATAQETGEETQSDAQDESAFLNSLRQFGWDGSDEKEGQQALLDAFSQQKSDYERLQARLEEQEELATYGREYLKAERERAEAERQQQEAQQTQAPEHWWTPPEFDFSTIEKYRDVTLAEDGTPQIGWKKNTPREVISSAEAYQEYVDKWATDLVQRPHEVLPQIIEHEFNRMFEERIEERERAARIDSFASAVKETNKDWMYTTDSQGREVLTDQGREMTQVLQQVAEAGVTDPERQWELAVAQYDYQNRLRGQAEQEATDTSKDVAAKRRKEHQKKGLEANPNRTGTVPKPGDDEAIEQNTNLSPGQQLIAQLRRDGVDI